MRKNNLILVSAASLALFLGGCSSKPAPQPAAEAPKTEAPAPVAEAPVGPTNVVSGELQEVDPQGSFVVVKTADGKQQRIETSADTEFRTLKHGTLEVAKGAEGVAKLTAAEVKKGTSVVISYSEKEGKLIAHQVKHASKKIVKQSEVVLHKIEQGGEKVVVKTADGAEHVYEVAKGVTVSTGNKLADAGKWTGNQIASGTKATLHFTEESGKKVVHFVDHK